MSLGFALLAVSSLYSGYSSYQSSKTQAMWQETEGAMAKADYERKSYLALEEGYRLRQQQAMDYIGAGVEIQGTPLLMLAETARRTEIEAESIRRTGQNYYTMSQQKASITRSEGRSGLISSIFSAGGYLLAGKK